MKKEKKKNNLISIIITVIIMLFLFITCLLILSKEGYLSFKHKEENNTIDNSNKEENNTVDNSNKEENNNSNKEENNEIENNEKEQTSLTNSNFKIPSIDVNKLDISKLEYQNGNISEGVLQEFQIQEYSAILNLNGSINIKYNGHIYIENNLTNINNAVQIIQYGVPSGTEDQLFYILLENGDVYYYRIGDLLEKKFTATKVEGISNITRLFIYNHPKNTWELVVINENNELISIKQDSV